MIKTLLNSNKEYNTQCGTNSLPEFSGKNKIEETYEKSLEYLYSFVNFEKLDKIPYNTKDLDLENFKKFLEALGNPQKDLIFIHIAGTNGKGSTAAYLESILRIAGFKTGLYTSPHLQDVRERIKINNTLIDKETFANLIQEIQPAVNFITNSESNYRTTFELLTAISLLYFQKNKVQFVVWETGLGGRLDATNVVRPVISIISNISLDHTNILGETLEQIAEEKAAIIKSGIPAVVAPQENSVMEIIDRFAKNIKAPLYRVDRELAWQQIEANSFGQTISFRFRQNSIPPFVANLQMLGRVQQENSGLAFLSAKILQKQGFEISDEAIRKGLEATKWSGRMELILEKSAGKRILLDCSHCPAAAKALAEDLTGQDFISYKKLILVLGISRSKDLEGICSELLPIAKEVIFTKTNFVRGAEPELLAKISQGKGAPERTRIVQQVSEAMKLALEWADNDDLIVVAGSVYVIGEAKDFLEKI